MAELIMQEESSTPSTPSANLWKAYFKANGLHTLDDLGGELGIPPVTGWMEVADTWTYASATTINVPTNATLKYQKGWGVRFKQGGNYKYMYITNVAATLLTVYGGSSYSIANAAITNIAVCPIPSAAFGFPHVLPYTPTGISASNVVITARFSLAGLICSVTMKAVFTGAITFTTMPSLPIPASVNNIFSSGLYSPSGVGGYYDASVGPTPTGLYPSVITSATVVEVRNSTTAAALSATSPVTWANGDAFTLSFFYEI